MKNTRKKSNAEYDEANAVINVAKSTETVGATESAAALDPQHALRHIHYIFFPLSQLFSS